MLRLVLLVLSLVSALRVIASTSFSIGSAQFSISTSCWIASTSFSIASAQFSISTSLDCQYFV